MRKLLVVLLVLLSASVSAQKIGKPGNPWSKVRIGATGQQVRVLLGAPTVGYGFTEGRSWNAWRVVDKSQGFSQVLYFGVTFFDNRVTEKEVCWLSEKWRGSGKYGLFDHYDVTWQW